MPRGAAPPPPKVTVAKPAKSMVADQDEYVGRFVAVDAVEVRARVSGYLETIHFKDGQLVKKGDLLFIIDRAALRGRARPGEGEPSRRRRPTSRSPRAT